MAELWDASASGVLRLPSGRLVRGRALKKRHEIDATFTLFTLGLKPPSTTHESRWLQWFDFWLPRSPDEARKTIAELWERSSSERVEVVCLGGRGRTGTTLACLAVLDGVPADEAVAFVRKNYHPKAVETPWQRRFVERFNN